MKLLKQAVEAQAPAFMKSFITIVDLFGEAGTPAGSEGAGVCYQ